MKHLTSLVATFSFISALIASPVVIDSFADEPDYRLNRDVLPSNYKITLTLDEDFGKNPIYQGIVNIKIEAQKAAVSEIVLHTTVEQIYSITLNDGQTTVSIAADKYEIDTVTHKLTIKTDTALAVGKTYTLGIIYHSILRDDMLGFYRSSYIDENGDEEWLATTQFEAISARRAFPCFDEPSFKATFDVSIIRPNAYKTLTNTKLRGSIAIGPNKMQDTFYQTPIMSTYLNAFIVSKFAKVEESTAEESIWARPEALATGVYAAGIAPQLSEKMGEFTGIMYKEQGLGKLDHVAIPDFTYGAMENWGLITYRESTLLWDEEQSSHRHKQRVATMIAHEISHNWFGNIVTLHWWSDTWLNEGFARYFEYHLLALV